MSIKVIRLFDLKAKKKIIYEMLHRFYYLFIR